MTRNKITVRSGSAKNEIEEEEVIKFVLRTKTQDVRVVNSFETEETGSWKWGGKNKISFEKCDVQQEVEVENNGNFEQREAKRQMPKTLQFIFFSLMFIHGRACLSSTVPKQEINNF